MKKESDGKLLMEEKKKNNSEPKANVTNESDGDGG